MSKFVDQATDGHPAYESGVLKPEKHYSLVRNITRYAIDAGIPQKYISTPLKEHCESVERSWLEHLEEHKDNDICGFAYIGKFKKPVYERMCAIAGCFLRNYIGARVIMMGDLIDAISSGDAPKERVLLIPNFYFSGVERTGVKNWAKDVQAVLGYLYSRRSKEQLTIIYIESLPKLKEDYGAEFIALLENYTQYKKTG